MHSRRARPTLRLLREDLIAGWAGPYPRRALNAGALHDLHPLSELPHPLIAKARESFGQDPQEDTPIGKIRGSTRINLWEIKIAHWRGGVWHDSETGVHWLVVGGLAKGDHQDHEDFYKRVARENSVAVPEHWKPTPDDMRLLKQETAARLLTQWELDLQQRVLGALRVTAEGGSTEFEISHPKPTEKPMGLARISVAIVRDDGYCADEISLELFPVHQYAASHLLWQGTIRMLISIEPPEQGWDRDRFAFTNIGDPGHWLDRAEALAALVATHELAQSIPGTHSHFAHREHLAGSTIDGTAVRALCGVFFVPVQDHGTLPECPACHQEISKYPS